METIIKQSQPILVPVIGKESGDRWILTGTYNGVKNLTGPWQYFFSLHGKDYKLTVPFKFDKLDGASVPRFIREIVKMGGREMPDEAWLPHDFIYYHKGQMPYMSLLVAEGDEWKEVKKVPKKFADQMFHHELRNPEHGLSNFKAPIAYLGVRLAVWKSW